ncbi:glycerol acyltransferase [Amylibacter kogurei]|uniref:Glycerol acyltransferase n=1 Tax=Paramylibacter kogurei TaxID=1889778 RepID=A0A2G5K1K5_9RHOB|nr:1-acyl-sn-glycerol-3-phosphate acyltransferase [Amylibacter kogurei]PIB23305.1 glycerol acyltransferase [Amylibacter kogurei]
MAYVFQYIRSVIFVILMYVWMLVLGIIGAIPAALSREWAYKFMRFYCLSVFWLARVLCGLTYEIRGKVPTGSVIVASKHQSFLDVMVNFYTVERGNFVMKKELKWAPILGFYAMRIGVAPVKRGARSKSMKEMVSGVEKEADTPSQLIIYPQGTRVPPGKYLPYKVGAAVLCQRFDRPCIPVATNVGVFWNKRGLYRKPGVAVFEYFEPLPKGLSVEDMTKEMERVIETNSNRLMAEAGFDVTPQDAS